MAHKKAKANFVNIAAHNCPRSRNLAQLSINASKARFPEKRVQLLSAKVDEILLGNSLSRYFLRNINFSASRDTTSARSAVRRLCTGRKSSVVYI